MRILGIVVGLMFVAFGSLVHLGIFADEVFGKLQALGSVAMGVFFVAYGVFGRTGIVSLDNDV